MLDFPIVGNFYYCNKNPKELKGTILKLQKEPTDERQSYLLDFSFSDLIIECDERLITLFKNSFQEHKGKFVKLGTYSCNINEIANFDHIIYAGSLGKYFRNDLNSFSKVPYLKNIKNYKDLELDNILGKNQGLKINYIHSTVEKISEKDEKFDVILNMEVIEHVSDVNLFINSCSKILSENGIMIFASLNRTLISYGLAIIGVEYILGWLPKGTHDWSKFIAPDELKILFSSNGLKIDEIIGMKYNPLFDSWKRSEDLSVNYLGLSSKINS